MALFSNSINISTHGLKAQSTRMNVISQNVANVDTPGYKRKLVSFRSEMNSAGSKVLIANHISLDRKPGERIYAPSHPLADGSGHFEGSNVDLVTELADAREAQRTYEANLKMFDQTRQMSSALMDLLKK